MTAAVAPPVRPRFGDRLLRSPLFDLLLGPHGVDRYLELIRPDLVVGEARAEVVKVEHQTARSATLTLRPNRAWAGCKAGQFVRAGFEIDGVRRTRTYSPAGSENASSDVIELTVTAHPEGVVSRHLNGATPPGTVVHLGPAQGEFVLPEERPERLLLISGGSGITPFMAMLRTLCDENHDGEVVFLHYARTAEDWLYAREVEALAARHRNLSSVYRTTRGPQAGPRLTPPRAGRSVPGRPWWVRRGVRAAGATRRGAHGVERARRHGGPPAGRDLHTAVSEPYRPRRRGDASFPAQRQPRGDRLRDAAGAGRGGRPVT